MINDIVMLMLMNGGQPHPIEQTHAQPICCNFYIFAPDLIIIRLYFIFPLYWAQCIGVVNIEECLSVFHQFRFCFGSVLRPSFFSSIV